MTGELFIKNIVPTVFIRKEKSGLKQLVKIEILSSKLRDVQLLILEGNNRQEIALGIIPAGESIQEIFMDELERETELEFILKSEGIACDLKTIPWIPPRHWTVHVVQLSHHDPGYTDIPSNVLKDHDRWLDQAIDMAMESDGLTEDAKFRIVVEQAWSIDHFLKHAPSERAEKAVKLIREGRFEVAAYSVI